MSNEKPLRESPVFSVNKLAQYMVVSATRRRSLITGQIEPAAVRTSKYKEARRIVARFCADPTRRSPHLLRSAALLRDRAADPACEEYQRNDFLDAARAVEAFMPIAYDARVRGLIATLGRGRGDDIEMGGVRVTVNPDIHYIEPGTERRVGAAKFHFARTEPLTVEALQYVSSLLLHFVKRKGDTPRGKACLAVDVFSGVTEAAPKTSRTRIRNLEAACQEIAERWPALYAQVAEKRQGLRR